MQCYGWHGIDGAGINRYYIYCAANPNWTRNQIYSAPYSYPSDNGINLTGINTAGVKPVSITPLFTQADIDAFTLNKNFRGNCNSCIGTLSTYDCINEICEKSSKYGTEGIYESKEACELANKYKFTEEEFNQINQLINKIKGEKCG